MFRIDAPAASPCNCVPKWVEGDGGPKAQCQCPGGQAEHGDAEKPYERARREMVERHANAWKRR